MNNENGNTAVILAELLTLIAKNDWRITSGFDTPYGYNISSMNVWVALDGDITICKKIPMMGNWQNNFPVQYMVTDMETGEETFYNTFKEAYEGEKEKCVCGACSPDGKIYCCVCNECGDFGLKKNWGNQPDRDYYICGECEGEYESEDECDGECDE